MTILIYDQYLGQISSECVNSVYQATSLGGGGEGPGDEASSSKKKDCRTIASSNNTLDM